LATTTHLEEHVEAAAVVSKVAKGLPAREALVQDAAQAVYVSSLVHTAAVWSQ
jgi:hypothetical protein